MSAGNLKDTAGDLPQYNILITGSSGVGKTALTIRFLTGRFIGHYVPDFELDYKSQVRLSDSNFMLKIFDSNPQNFMKHIDNVDACLFVYSMTDAESAKSVIKMINIASNKVSGKKHTPLLVMVLANKTDCTKSWR
ncbi:Ras-related and estrogen-regulated growth inhibitor [Thelohanellus kitauei]|uniref:small monomeric GTPase n=1 Tax=Thelohanellus kitauei TaxID=669202 RepID=A0A0C2MH89_THEKT|nr:Ras-related and estrogen-regulated growth inhibitor [Thelohanellus kitauei]